MKAVLISKAGTPVAGNVSLVHDWPEPRPPGPGMVTVRTLASALNHLDLWVGRGVPGLNLTYPRVSGSDGCGVVEAVGEGVDKGWVGRRVIMNAAVRRAEIARPSDPPGTTLAADYEVIGEHIHGAHAEKFTAPAANLAALDDTWSATEGAAFGLAALTAYSMMVGKAGLRSGQSVLITGIGGGVALAALAIARHFSCPTAVTSRHADKLERARGLGAECLIHDQGQDWSRDVRAWTGKRGVDMAVDSSGKATHLNCIKSLARGGAYVTPGCTSGPDATTDLARIFWNQLRLYGSTMGSNTEFGEVVSLYRNGGLKPVVDRVFGPGDCRAAFERLEAGGQFGKVVISWEGA